jgi:multiple sugar transport system substrate-binding protein
MRSETRLNRRDFLRLAAGAAGGALLAGCRPTEAPEATAAPAKKEEPTATPVPAEPTEILYHVRTGSQGDYYQIQTEAFAKAQDEVRVTLEQTPGAEYTQKLTTLLAGGELGDGFWNAPFGTFYPWSARGICLDMFPLVEADNFDLSVFFPASIDQLTVNGKLTGWPQGAHPGWTSMFTNLDAWEEAGASLPEWEWTYEKEWLEAVQAVALDEDGDGETDRFGFMFDYNAQGAYTFIKCWGGDWIDPDGLSTSMIDSVETTAALMFMHDLVHVHKISPAQESIISGYGAMFANGLTASWAHGIWHVSTQKELVQDKFKWQVFPMAAGPAGRGSFVGIDTMCIYSGTEHPEAVFEWHKWMTTKDAGLQQMDHGFTPSLRFDAWEDPKLADDVNFDPARRWMEVAKPTTFPANGRAREFASTFNQGFQAFMLEKDDPKPLLQELHEAVQAVLDKPLLSE